MIKPDQRDEIIEMINANSFNTEDGDNCISVEDVIEIIDIFLGTKC